MKRHEEWLVEPDGKGAFNAVFEMYEDGKLTGRGAALSGVSKAEAKAHVEMAIKSNEVCAAHKALAEPHFNKKNWKMAAESIVYGDEDHADKVADALAYFLGGSFVKPVSGLNGVPGGKGWLVGSRGYYHHVGA